MGLPVLLSLSLSSLGLFHAYQSRSQFYPAVIFIVKSNLLMAIAYFQALVLVVLLGHLMKKVFLGNLHASEFESLIDRSWYAVLETFLTFAIFKDNFSDKFVAFFSILLFLKVFHWMGEVRVNFMEQSPAHSLLFHSRVIFLAYILAMLDIKLIYHAYNSTQSDGDSVQLVFGFEYAVLLTVVLNFFIKYILHTVDLLQESSWHNKPIYMLYAELIIGFIKFLLYSIFILITLRIYTIPLFAIRPMYINMRALKKTFVGIVSSYQAIHIMDAHYGEATPEQLAAADSLCTICRDEMMASETKILPCNHIFHKSCLRSWFQRQQTCPTCRHDVIQSFRRQRQANESNNNNNNANTNNVNNDVAARANNGAPVAPAASAASNTDQAQQQQAAPNPQAFPSSPLPPLNPTLLAQMAAHLPQGLLSGEAFPGGLPFPPPPPPLFSAFRPPPLPPADFKGLSEEELRAMEGNERRNVEARIECLRNIQVLLDAAVLEMQQYSSILSTEQMGAAAASTSGVSASPSKKEEEKLIGTRSKEEEVGASSSSSPEEIIRKMDSSQQPSEEELRRRRLQRFNQNDSSSS
ncbi:Synoviolinlike [Caligus rogercresseyi]|uniref:RING-type E3 ubiquitin transferase n=2 Tax=Caligus rogercresseyi TaxID=217165 RepID=A0A7T8QWQ9_CALRO|nr:Synoviolinlike [Caligus rogercresseyi]